jgi:hypothetical protein
MTTNDLSNKEKMLLTYIKQIAKEEFPNLDLSDHGAFMEMFGIPHVKLLTPLLEYADRIRLTQSIDNASLMSEEEMDELAAGHFFYRKSGDYASGYITLSFDDIPANGTIQIPAGIQVESRTNLRFKTIETLIYNEEELSSFYDVESFTYRIPVLCEAENQGSKYNVSENEIVNILTPIPHLSDVTNEISFRGGIDKESNIELAYRIRETAGSPNFGIERGWVRFIKSFDDVRDAIIVGYGHPLMERDIIGTLPEGTYNQEISPNVHWGGKIDVYIRGTRLSEYSETKKIELNEDGELIVPLSKHPTHDILEITFTSSRYTDPELDDSFFIVKDFLLLKDEHYDKFGTLYESSWVVIKDERLNNTDIAHVRYRYNFLIQQIHDEIYKKDNRPPASDVLLKEVRKKYLHGAMIVRLDTVIGIKEKDRSAIRQRLYNWIDDLKTGEELQFSDLAEPIYDKAGDIVDTKVDYIVLPSQFIVSDYDNKYLYYCLSLKKRDFLTQIQSDSVYFSKWIPNYQDQVTIYEFFDIMHLLTYQNITKGAWKELAFKNYEWGEKIYHIEIAKRMLAYATAIQKLSPAKWRTKETDTFDLGHLSIYEDVKYTKNDVEGYVNLYESIANSGEAEKKIQNMLHLLVYNLVMLYVANTEEIGELNKKELFDWLLELTKGTPIDYEVHH